ARFSSTLGSRLRSNRQVALALVTPSVVEGHPERSRGAPRAQTSTRVRSLRAKLRGARFSTSLEQTRTIAFVTPSVAEGHPEHKQARECEVCERSSRGARC